MCVNTHVAGLYGEIEGESVVEVFACKLVEC